MYEEDWGVPEIVDCHVHVNRFDLMKPACRALIEQNPTFQEMEPLTKDPQALLDHMAEEGIAELWAINYCAKDIMGYGWEVNEWASEYVAHNPRVLKSTGGYDPRHDGAGDQAAARLQDLGLIGCKIHPVHQDLAANSHRQDSAIGENMRLFYEELQARDMPVWFHTGTSIFPGANNHHQYLDPVVDVITDFPRLNVIMCHGGRPGETDLANEIMRGYRNAWMDVSSMPPSRIPQWYPKLEEIGNRVLWGSDWPGPKVPGMASNVMHFMAQGYPEALSDAILRENARRLLGND